MKSEVMHRKVAFIVHRYPRSGPTIWRAVRGESGRSPPRAKTTEANNETTVSQRYKFRRARHASCHSANATPGGPQVLGVTSYILLTETTQNISAITAKAESAKKSIAFVAGRIRPVNNKPLSYCLAGAFLLMTSDSCWARSVRLSCSRRATWMRAASR